MFLEHVNLNVSDARRTRDFLQEVFGWKTRWEGTTDYGHTVHVGDADDYLSLTSPHRPPDAPRPVGAVFNHVGVLVDDLDDVERRLEVAGVATYAHGDYEPGRCFYFEDADGIEYEVVSYS